MLDDLGDDYVPGGRFLTHLAPKHAEAYRAMRSISMLTHLNIYGMINPRWPR